MISMRKISAYVLVFSLITGSASQAAIDPATISAVIQGVRAGFEMAKGLVVFLKDLRKTTREASVLRSPGRDSVAIYVRTLSNGELEVGIIHIKSINSLRRDYLLLAQTDADRNSILKILKDGSTEGIQILETVADADRFRNPSLVNSLFSNFKLERPLIAHHVVLSGKPEKTGVLKPLSFKGFPGIVEFFLPVDKADNLASKFVELHDGEEFASIVEKNSDILSGEWLSIKPNGRDDIRVNIILRDWIAKKAVLASEGDKETIDSLLEKFDATVKSGAEIIEKTMPKTDEKDKKGDS